VTGWLGQKALDAEPVGASPCPKWLVRSGAAAPCVNGQWHDAAAAGVQALARARRGRLDVGWRTQAGSLSCCALSEPRGRIPWRQWPTSGAASATR
jgi:hypothetical protein